MNNGNNGNQGNDRKSVTQGRVPVKKYVKKKQNNTLPLVLAIIISVLVVAAFVIAILTAAGTIDLFGKGNGDTTAGIETKDPEKTGPSDNTSNAEDTGNPGNESDDIPSPDKVSYKFLELNPEDIKKGDLVLIDAEHGIDVPKQDEMVNVYAFKTKDYGLDSSTMYLKQSTVEILNKMMEAFAADNPELTDVIVKYGFRTFEEQDSYFKAGKSTTEAGHSDYHSGASFTLKIYRQGKGTLSIDDVGGDYMWLGRNCYRYGFVQRYPSEKSKITGFKNENWLMRYVGVPHATYMYDYNLCLEEYLEDMRNNHSYQDEHAKVTCDDGTEYEIYYVGATTAGTTKIPVPENREYTISGDNMSGFIVAVNLGKK